MFLVTFSLRLLLVETALSRASEFDPVARGFVHKDFSHLNSIKT